jgi:uncharacterized protein YxjI
MPLYQYPLNLRFKLLALAPRIIVTDASGTEQLFVNQKIFNLKEDVRIYNNSKKEREVYRMRADRIIDFSANYKFFDSAGTNQIGSIKRKGIRSLWRATYFIDNASGQTAFHVKEDNPWVKVLDALLIEVPIVGFFTGYFLNPTYTAYRGTNREDESQPVMKLIKQPAFFESGYEIQLVNPQVSEEDELAVLLGLMMMVQLERRRG